MIKFSNSGETKAIATYKNCVTNITVSDPNNWGNTYTANGGVLSLTTPPNTSSTRSETVTISYSAGTSSCSKTVDIEQLGFATMYRWINLDPSTDYYCSGTTKYYKQQEQVSYDGGSSWSNVSPAEYRWGSSAETQSTDCGYVPPAPKWIATYSDSHTESAECDSSSAITKNEINKTNLVDVEIGDCATSIGNEAFYGCRNLTSIVIPNSVTSIGNHAFDACTGLTSCTIGSGVTSIGDVAFYGCNSLTSIDIPSGVTSIGNGVFKNCYSLSSCTIGSGVTSIGEDAFNSCSGLTSCTIGSGVTTIGSYAFYYCRSLTSITVNATTPPTLGGNVFYNTNNCPIYVPANKVNTYKAASGWSSYASRIQAIT